MLDSAWFFSAVNSDSSNKGETMVRYIVILLAMLELAWAEDGALAPANWARSVVTAVIIGESGGHGLKGCEAVYEVIHSRASRKRSTCLHEVLRPKQFSCLNNTTSALLVRKHRKHPMWGKVYEFVGERPQYTHTGTKWSNACTHYHAVKITPYWAKGKMPFRVFGGHKWYNNVK